MTTQTLKFVINWHRRQASKLRRAYNPRRITARVHEDAAKHFSAMLGRLKRELRR